MNVDVGGSVNRRHGGVNSSVETGHVFKICCPGRPCLDKEAKEQLEARIFKDRACKKRMCPAEVVNKKGRMSSGSSAKGDFWESNYELH